jgi:hypothetical protein
MKRITKTARSQIQQQREELTSAYDGAFSAVREDELDIAMNKPTSVWAAGRLGTLKMYERALNAHYHKTRHQV